MISDETLLTYLRAPESELETLRRLEKAAIAKIQKDTGRYFGPEAEIVEIVRFRGWPLSIANEPIDGSITSLESSSDGQSWSVEAATSYYVFGSFIFGTSNRFTPLTAPQFWRVTYDAGFEQDDDDVWAAPEDIQQAVIMLVGHWNENREAVVVGQSVSPELELAYTSLISGHTRASVG